MKYQDILKYNKAYFDDVYERKFTGDVLGYVTPVSAIVFFFVHCLLIRNNILSDCEQISGIT